MNTYEVTWKLTLVDGRKLEHGPVAFLADTLDAAEERADRIIERFEVWQGISGKVVARYTSTSKIS